MQDRAPKSPLSGKAKMALKRSGVRVLESKKIEVDGLQVVGAHYRDVGNPERYQAIVRRAGIDRERSQQQSAISQNQRQEPKPYGGFTRINAD